MIKLLVLICPMLCSCVYQPIVLEPVQVLATNANEIATVHLMHLLWVAKPGHADVRLIPIVPETDNMRLSIRVKDLIELVEEAQILCHVTDRLACFLQRCPTEEELWKDWAEECLTEEQRKLAEEP